MTKYEYLIKRADDCTIKAAATSDVNLKMFYTNASEGFKCKASKLTLEQAKEELTC